MTFNSIRLGQVMERLCRQLHVFMEEDSVNFRLQRSIIPHLIESETDPFSKVIGNLSLRL